MATVVNNPGNTDNNSTLSTVFAIIALLIVVFLFLYYGLPALTNQNGGTTAPANTRPIESTEGGDAGNTLDVDVPEQVDVNLNNGSE